ncbi:hypothetical protein ATE80_22155 [Streptomyces kanasensis]|uniref:Aminoglycoside phosphotransferase domain-containing protein n=1 Tax=Streptomyces kanasensis TaxID=936756 RepID=A0A100Y2V5_9ACTN|nr:hypothetical protein ATE80_22155 [Streptomyces kanasensis]
MSHRGTRSTPELAGAAALVSRHLGTGARVTDMERLTGGTFNDVYRLTLEGAEQSAAVLKISPPPSVPLMTYERDLLRTEAGFYAHGSTVEGVPLPRVLGTDFDRKSADGDRLLMTHLDGRDWHTARSTIPACERDRLRCDLGRIIGELHHVQGVGFGYPQHGTPGTGSPWRTVFLAMLSDVLHDARTYNARLPFDEDRLLRTIDQKAWLLDDVTVPTLVHFDLWDGNVLVAEREGRLEISGIIDAERAFWGDPLADLVSPALFGDISDDEAFLAGYCSARGRGFRLGDHDLGRVAMYRIYLALIVLVEGTPRGYDPDERAPLTDRATADLFAALDRLHRTVPQATGEA